MKRFSLVAAFFTAALCVPALAQDHSVVVSGMAPMASGGYQIKAVRVAFADLDIASGQGAAALLDRIQMASRAVCGERNGQIMNADRSKEFSACQARATQTAVQAIGAPALVQVATQR